MTATPSTNTLDQALADLPAKLRVHELAKRAGLASKDVIAALAAAGVVVGSAASSVGIADATALLRSLFASSATVESTDPGPAVTETPSPALPDLVDAVAQSVPEQDPGFFAAPLFLPPAEPKPARRRRSTKATAEAAEPTLAETVADLPVEPVALDVVPDTLTPEGDAAAAEPEEVGTSRSGRRRRGRSGGRGRAAAGDDQVEGATEGTLEVVVAEAIDGVFDQETDAGGEAAPDADLDGAQEDDDTDQAARRRRRRGRRGRGRAGSEGQDENEFEGAAAEGDAESSSTGDAGDGDDESNEDESNDEGGTRRRRRRRRRTGAPEAGSDEANREDDPDNTVVHVREPRTTSDKTPVSSGTSEVQGIRGSTRLEAKRQRRREGRGSRSRPQILTEAEFLARREAVERVMAVRQRGDLAQVALLEDGVLVEHFVSQAGSESLMGNIYLGKVQNVLPSMEAAFVDIGKGRNAVLYAGEVNWDAAGLAGKARRIEIALSGGDTMLVQVSKDPVGHKGARLTTQISLPGRFLVYVPGGGATGISRKLPDTERKRLKSILDRIVPEDAGVIIRTAAEGVAEEELARDVERLKSQWEEISRQAEKKSNAPLLLSAEPDTLIKVVRDLFNSDITRLILDGDRAYEPVAAYINAVAPELADRVSRYDGPNDVFAAYRIDEQIAKALERKVYLPSGGSLVIDRTEAMTVVDVNTGKYTGSGGNLEETVTKNNLEAAEEVVRQLRLRDIGGIIVVDFIDMVLESNRELVMRRLTECLGRDRTRHQVAEVTSLGLIQMTRKKMGTGLVEAFSEPCPHCHGRGLILHDVPVPDHSGGNAGGDNRPESGDGDSRGGRNRRSGRRQEAPALEQPIVKIVPASVRPPDPRGPKPPGRGADEQQSALPESIETIPVDEAPVPAPSAEPFSGGRSVGAAASDASFNAPLSRDASDAVSAVFAALDAQAVRQAVEQEPGSSTPDPGTAAVVGMETSTGGRRRSGRRAAGRPAGAPNATTTTSPAALPSGSAPTAPTEPVSAREPESIPVTAAPAATESQPATPSESQPQIADSATEQATTVQATELSTEPGTEPAAKAPRRRGSRAAGAAKSTGVVEPIVAAPSSSNGASSEPPSPVVSNGAAALPEDGSSVALDAPIKATAPRRRRAASRPAGPAAAPSADVTAH